MTAAILAASLAVGALAQDAPDHNARPAPQTPRLVCGLQHLLDGNPSALRTSGLLEHTDARSASWPTHGAMADLFRQVHRHTQPWGARTYVAIRDAADYCLDVHEGIVGVPEPGSQVMIFPDLEYATLQRSAYPRHPYVDPEWGQLDQVLMATLLEQIRVRARMRWPGVEVLAGPYRPLRAVGFAQARAGEVGFGFEQTWGAPALGTLLLATDAGWVHTYATEDPAQLAAKRITHEEYAYQNTIWQIRQFLAAGAPIERVVVCDWLYTPDGWSEEVEAIRRGRDRAVADLGPLPFSVDIMICGGGPDFVQWHLDAPLDEVDPQMRAEAVAARWNAEIAAGWGDEVAAPAPAQ